ncbi:MAG: phage holin family protein [Clostridia bacterium]|nr:phage holin family protein [Clostridia bacterium]
MEKRALQAVFSAAVSAFSVYFNQMAVPLAVLVIMMIIDYVSGMTAAYINSELSSRKGMVGIVKKISYLFAVAAGMGIDWLLCTGLAQVGIVMNYSIMFGNLVTVWLVINELISILENLSKAEVPLPDFLVRFVRRLKMTVDKKLDDDNAGHDEKSA